MPIASNFSSNRTPMGWLEIAMGEDPYTSCVNKFGRNEATAAGDGLWVLSTAFPSVDDITPGVATLTSSSDADNKTTATGALTVRCFGLDADKAEQEETVTLSGTDNVVTSGTYSRIFRIKVLTAGSGDVAAGNITATIGGTSVAYILAGRTQTEQAWYTVPAGVVGVVTRMRASFANTSATRSTDIELMVTAAEDSNVLLPINTMSLVTVGDGEVEVNFDPAIKVTEKLDIMLRCKAISAGSQVHGSFDMYLMRR